MASDKIKFEGFSAEELLSRPDEEIDQLVLCDEALVFNVGSAQILGKFKIVNRLLILELAQIDGGGEGVLPAIASLSQGIAKKRDLTGVDWLVHAVTCADPNPKLKRVLERKGFKIKEIENVGKVYYQHQDVNG